MFLHGKKRVTSSVRPKDFKSFDILAKIKPSQFTFLNFSSGVGGCPEFEEPTLARAFIKKTKELSLLFNEDGEICIEDFKYSEKYAICLAQELKNRAAKLFFDKTTEKCTSVLLIHVPKKNGAYISSSVASKKGKLGYEGVYSSAKVCLALKLKKRAIQLLAELVTSIPTKCFPIRLQDVRVEVIDLLLENGQETVGDIDLHEELKRAESHQY